MNKKNDKNLLVDAVLGGAITRNYKTPARSDEFRSEINKKINRIAGKLEGIRKMIDADRPCTDVIMQLSGTQSILRSIECAIVTDYLQNVAVDQLSKNNELVCKEIELIAKMYR